MSVVQPVLIINSHDYAEHIEELTPGLNDLETKESKTSSLAWD